MGRHGYSEGDELDALELGRWRGRIASASRGRRGQRFFRELIAALEAMPKKELISGEGLGDRYDYTLANAKTGEACALGAMGIARGIDMSKVDPENHDLLGSMFDVSPCLIQECEWENDEQSFWDRNSPDKPQRLSRYEGMLRWARENLKEPVS